KLAKIQALSKRGLTLPEIKSSLEGESKIKKVLIVDDEIEVVDLLKALIREKFPAWQIQSATNGFVAGRMIGEFYPDLVILDLMLPGVDGFGVCKQIRLDPLLNGIRILAITGYDSPEMRTKIMECGADDYLAKPMDNHVLIETLKKLMEGG